MTRGPAARLQNELAQQLVLQAGLGDGEVDDGDARAELGREVRVGQPRGAEQAERLRVVHLPPAQHQLHRIRQRRLSSRPMAPAHVWEKWDRASGSQGLRKRAVTDKACMMRRAVGNLSGTSEGFVARLLVGQLHGEPAALADDAAVQHRVQHRVKLLLYVLYQQRPPQCQALLHMSGRINAPKA